MTRKICWISLQGQPGKNSWSMAQRSAALELTEGSWQKESPQGYEYTDIERRTGHSGCSVQRYLSGFSKVVRFYSRGYSLPEIRELADMSERLILEYLDLYETFRDRPESQIRFQQILSEPLPSKKSLITWNKNPGVMNS